MRLIDADRLKAEIMGWRKERKMKKRVYLATIKSDITRGRVILAADLEKMMLEIIADGI